MQEVSILSQAFQQLLFQLPVLAAAITGFILLGRHQSVLGSARTPAMIGLSAIFALAVIGPFYQAWIHKLVMTKGVSESALILMVSSIVLNILWGISILLLVLSVFFGRPSSSGSQGPV